MSALLWTVWRIVQIRRFRGAQRTTLAHAGVRQSRQTIEKQWTTQKVIWLIANYYYYYCRQKRWLGAACRATQHGSEIRVVYSFAVPQSLHHRHLFVLNIDHFAFAFNGKAGTWHGSHQETCTEFNRNTHINIRFTVNFQMSISDSLFIDDGIVFAYVRLNFDIFIVQWNAGVAISNRLFTRR